MADLMHDFSTIASATDKDHSCITPVILILNNKSTVLKSLLDISMIGRVYSSNSYVHSLTISSINGFSSIIFYLSLSDSE